MADDARTRSPGPTERREAYTHGHSANQARNYQARSAAVQASFLLPHLRPGLRLLDCGCGTGTITTGLAEASWPGRLERRSLADGVDVVLDGAHNPAGADALAAWLRSAGFAPAAGGRRLLARARVSRGPKGREVGAGHDW